MLAVFAVIGAGCAEERADNAYNNEADTTDNRTADTRANDTVARDSYRTDDTYRSRDTISAATTEKARQAASTFGVDELNDIENWKITNNGEEIGEIDRIGIDRNTGELLAVVGLEGVVGVNMKEVGVPLSRLKMAGEETLSTDLTKNELQSRRDIDPWDGQLADDDDLEDAMD